MKALHFFNNIYCIINAQERPITIFLYELIN